MSFWLTDPELFLYVKGIDPDDVHLRRCKKSASSSSSSSSLVVPMKSDDFDYVRKVENHLELIDDLFPWEEPDYKRLVKYIFERHLLVNSHGFVIAELHKVDEDGNKMIDDANEEVLIYLRSLDVLPLKPYIPQLRERPIPLRTVNYLGDLNGKAAMMEVDSQVTKLTTRVENLEAENKALEAENKALDSNVKTLEGKVTKLIADMDKVVWWNNLTNNDWVGVEGLPQVQYDFTIVGPLGTFTTDENHTNVRAIYWYKITLNGYGGLYKLISIEDLTPNKEMARFSPSSWVSFKSKGNGKTYVRM